MSPEDALRAHLDALAKPPGSLGQLEALAVRLAAAQRTERPTAQAPRVLVFAGDHEGNFMAFDAKDGRNLWHYQTGSRIWGAAAMTFMLDQRQLVLIPSGTTLTAFALPD